MREILFRGKRVDNGEWVYGSLILCGITGKSFIFPVGNDANESEKVGHEGCLMIATLEVIPETIGQFTGLTDKNGKKIFEGDVLAGCEGYRRTYGDVEVKICQWEDAQFVRKNSEDDYSDDDISDGYGCTIGNKGFRVSISNIETQQYFEVIGNVHDNSELLKEE